MSDAQSSVTAEDVLREFYVRYGMWWDRGGWTLEGIVQPLLEWVRAHPLEQPKP